MNAQANQPSKALNPRAVRPGFTLLEVIISAGILAVVLTAAYGFMVSFDNATRYNVKYYELYEKVQDDQIDLDRLLTSAYQVTVSDGAGQVNGNPRSVTFNTISGFQDDGVTPIASARILAWTKTGTVSESDYQFDCDGNGVKDETLTIGSLTLDGVQMGDANVIEPIITLEGEEITITLKRINSQGYVAKRTLEAVFNPDSEIIQ